MIRQPQNNHKVTEAPPPVSPGRLKTLLSAVLLPGLLAVCLLPISDNASADIGASHEALVSEFASFNTPGVVDGRVEDIAIDGDTVFVGGTFTQIQEPLSNEIIDQPYLFAYSKSTGNIIRDFDPQLNNVVNALETTGEGTGVFVGGVFNVLNGEGNNRGLVKLNNNGDRVSGFSARPDATVSTLVRLENTLYIGGNFDFISNTPIDKLAAIETTSGAVLPNIDLDFGGLLTNQRDIVRVQGIDDMDITSDGRLMVIIGNWETIDGFSRPRLAVIELDGQARVSQWNTNIFDGHCPGSLFVQYILGIDIAADDSYFVTGSSGFRIRGNPACDSITRFEFGDLTNTDAKPTWVNYTGGDSVYDVVATDHAVYAGGHFEFLNNDTGSGNAAGPGGVPRRGLAALDPLNGLTLLNWRSDRNPRGLGVFAMIAEDEGLYIGDDTDFLNGSEHQKLKFLPITTDIVARAEAPSLPTTMLSVTNNTLTASSFDGAAGGIGDTIEMNNSSFSNVRGAMYIGGQLFYANAGEQVIMHQYNGESFEPGVVVDQLGLTNNEWNWARIGGMFFDYEWSRVYYTQQGDSRLFYRAFTPDSPYFGNDEFVAEQQGDILWGDVSGMDVIDDHLYYVRTDGTLYRAEINGAAVVPGTTTAISGLNIDGRRWDNNFLAFMGEGVTLGLPDAEFVFESSGTQSNGRFRTFEFAVAPGEPVVVSVEWIDPNAQVNLFVRDQNGETVASDNSATGSPKFVTAPAGTGGIYTAAILIKQGATSYTVRVNPVGGVPVEPAPTPEPQPMLADFEFSSSGSNANGRFRSFNFPVEAGELVEARVNWDVLGTDVRVFLRDETRSQVARNTNGDGSAIVTTIAQTSGQWSVAVLANTDTVVNYDVLVDTLSDFTVQEPLADFEFSSTGSDNNGRFQSFRFDVVAGETVDAQILWTDLSADVRVFLRDETGSQVDRDTVGNGLGAVSAVAQSSGQWSVAVLVRSGTNVTYEGLVNAN